MTAFHGVGAGSRTEALQVIGVAAPPAADDLRRGARRLADALDDWERSLGADAPRPPEDPAPTVRRLAEALEELDGWVGEVGRAFAVADDQALWPRPRWWDPPGVPSPPGLVDDLVDVADGLAALDRLDDDDLLALGARRLAELGRDVRRPVSERDRLGRAAIAAALDELALAPEDARQLEVVLASRVEVLAFRPPVGGREPELVFAVGGLADAEHVAIYVPGTTHGVRTFGEDAAVATRLRRAVTTVGGRGAVVVDLYDAPDSLPMAARTTYARNHLDDLVALGADVRAAAGGARVTVIGHSYGSYTAGQAGAAGMDGDALVLLGTPGTGVRHADDLGIDEVWVARAPKDPIEIAADADQRLAARPLVPAAVALGPDPADPEFGALAFEVNEPDRSPEDPDYASGHSEYLAPGTLSLLNVARIVAGREPSVPVVADVGERLDLADGPGPGWLDRATTRRDPEWYVGTDATRARP